MMVPGVINYGVQVWDGQDFRALGVFDVREEADAEMARHKRIMPNCPARIVHIEVVDLYMPEGARS